MKPNKRSHESRKRYMYICIYILTHIPDMHFPTRSSVSDDHDFAKRSSLGTQLHTSVIQKLHGR